MAERDYENTISYAEEKGMKKGIIKIATNLKLQGIDTEQISKATDLEIEEIKKL